MILKDDEKNKIINDASDMLNGIYCFDGLWNMEPCPEKIENKKIKWNVSYNGDVEWSYMFTRMEYLYKFILAYEISNDKKYIKHGLKIINKWYKDNKKYIYKYVGKVNNVLFKNNYAHRTLDLAIMCTNILDYAFYLKDNNLINKTQYNKYISIIKKVINYLIPKTDNDEMSFSNWGAIINSNILYCLYKLNINTNKIDSRLIRILNNQILSNGAQIESSPMYLVQIILVLFKIINLNNCKIKEELTNITNKSCNYLLNISNLDNCLPNFGDSDLTNISDIMYMSKVITENNNYIVNKDLDLEFRFKYNLEKGNNLKNNFNELLINYKDQTVYKNYNNGTYLLCSNIERRRGGHKHYDYMSILYAEYGKDLLVDLGRYSYKNDKTRATLVGPSGHNITCFKDKYFKYFTNFVTSQSVNCFDNQLIKNDNYFSIKMSSEYGYDNNMIERFVTYIKDVGLIVTDIIKDNLNSNYETYFNIGLDYEINNNIISYKDNKIYYSNDLNLNYKLNDVLYSKRYNEKDTIEQMKFEFSNKKITHYFLKNNISIKVKYDEDKIEYICEDKKIIIRRNEYGI